MVWKNEKNTNGVKILLAMPVRGDGGRAVVINLQ